MGVTMLESIFEKMSAIVQKIAVKICINTSMACIIKVVFELKTLPFKTTKTLFSSMDFTFLAELFESLERAPSRIEMTNLLARALNEVPSNDIKECVYLLQGKLCPDYEGLELGLGENLVIASFEKSTGYSKEKIEERFRKTGDLGEVIQELSSLRLQKSLFTERLSVQKVFLSLKKIAGSEGKGSQESKLKLLAQLLNSATPLEAKFVVRIVLGKTRLGVGDSTILDALALIYSAEFEKKNVLQVKKIEENLKEKKDEKRTAEKALRLKQLLREKIEEKYNIFPDLGFLAFKLKQKGLEGLNEISITPGTPVRPTLAERLSNSNEIIEKLGKCAVEHKLDGFRVSVHKNRVWLFSRKMEEMTHMFPEIVEGVQKQVNVKSAILEGEALAFNEKEKRFHPFQVTIQRKRKHGINEKAKEFPLTLFLFDAMMINDKDIMGLPFMERRKKLEEIVLKGNRLKLTNLIITDSSTKIDDFFSISVKNGLEGIIAKDLNAPYIAGARKFSWIKLKKSYAKDLADTIDVVIIGYFFGKGKRTRFGVGALLSAVYDEVSDSFKSVAKIGTGISEEQLKELEEMLSGIALKKKPLNVESEIEPDVWVKPVHVIEVAADEITRSPIHAAAKTSEGGLALRFPRMFRFRPDKSAFEATSEAELVSLAHKTEK
jgi:DNA ligase 1